MQRSVLGFHVFELFKLVRLTVAVMLRFGRLLQPHCCWPSLELEPHYFVRMVEC